MSNKIIVFCTVASVSEGKYLAQALVAEELVACVTLLPPVQSVYRWQGKIEEAEEVLLLIKTREGRWEAVRQRIQALHSYENPEIIAVPITTGSPAYLEWIDRSTGLQ
ncbi:MAG: divalent-cation tolerance protein CutA [Bryobacterales bacterium]|nr:divalent-cation tolerance protein CutA [Bryobacterales bacterium]